MAGCAVDHIAGPGTQTIKKTCKKAIADGYHRSSCASRKAYYGPSFSTAGDTGTDRRNSAGEESARGYGGGGGASTTGRYQTRSLS